MPPLQAQMVERLSPGQTAGVGPSRAELPSMVLFCVNQKLAEKKGRLTMDPKCIMGVLHFWLCIHLSFNLPCDRCLRMLRETAAQRCRMICPR